jgi:hypothetical protein
VLTAIAIVPSAPVLVPELAGAAAAELADLREAVLSVAAALPARWIVVGVGSEDVEVGPETLGTFAGFGVDTRVRLSPGPVDGRPKPLPLCVLIAGWVRGEANPDALAQARVYAADTTADAALGAGRLLRAELEQSAEPVGVLVVADGATTLTPPAPGGYVPGSPVVQHAVDAALAAGDLAMLKMLPDTIHGRVAYQVLAGVTETAPRSAQEFYRGAPYGVGYFVGAWQP